MPPPYKFTASNLALALRVLHPRPRALLVGKAISNDDSAIAVKAWKEFVGELAIENRLLIDVGLTNQNVDLRSLTHVPLVAAA